MTITLTCANCKRQEDHENPWAFPDWYKVTPQDGTMRAFMVCRKECGVSWFMQQQKEVAHATP